MKQKSNALWLGSMILATTAMAACGGAEKPPVKTPPPPPAAEPVAETEAAPATKPGDDPKESDINISDAIREACGLTDTDAYFHYDSANIRAEDKAVLTKLADCFTEGALKGQTMRLVGHADPRGEPEYNLVLGGERADNVAQAIIGAGLDKNQVTTTSRGEMDAKGVDEDSWSKDRRVDIVLVKNP
ncbi:MAG: OmpA family protein [Polyangiaceae bacterium]|nr:OmpA family protein [Polyangiaceae bacterium]